MPKKTSGRGHYNFIFFLNHVLRKSERTLAFSYIYICVCVCVFYLLRFANFPRQNQVFIFIFYVYTRGDREIRTSDFRFIRLGHS
jgi:hypothetical protein